MSRLVLKNAAVFLQEFKKKDIIIEDGIIKDIVDECDLEGFDLSGMVVAPAFIDPHVHLREPGYAYKETIKTGSMAAARGGYSTIFLMPNIKPVPDCKESFQVVQDIINRDAAIECLQLGSITKGEKGQELSEMSEIPTIGFSDDGVGVADSKMMYEAMKMAHDLNKPIISHCEDLALTYGGSFNESDFTRRNNLKGNLDISETAQVARDLVLAKKTGVHYHVCHISSIDTLDLIRVYKIMGANVTCEVTPHHLLLCDSDLKLEGNYKMNPPVRDKKSQEALIEGLNDGSIDCIATDHAPHTEEEKSKGENSLYGIVGLETSFPLLYTNLVLKKRISFATLLKAMSLNVAKCFGLESNEIIVGNKANLVVIDIDKEFKIDASSFASMGRNTPFDKQTVKGKVVMNVFKGEIIWNEKN